MDIRITPGKPGESGTVVTRFRKGKHALHLLGAPVVYQVHFNFELGTMPCLEENCPHCDNPDWHERTEGYAPALLRRGAEWRPIVAVFTKKTIVNVGESLTRGQVIHLEVTMHGDSPRQYAHFFREPILTPDLPPAFPVLPHLLRLWYPKRRPDVEALKLPPPMPAADYSRRLASAAEFDDEERKDLLGLPSKSVEARMLAEEERQRQADIAAGGKELDGAYLEVNPNFASNFRNLESKVNAGRGIPEPVSMEDLTAGRPRPSGNGHAGKGGAR